MFIRQISEGEKIPTGLSYIHAIPDHQDRCTFFWAFYCHIPWEPNHYCGRLYLYRRKTDPWFKTRLELDAWKWNNLNISF